MTKFFKSAYRVYDSVLATLTTIVRGLFWDVLFLAGCSVFVYGVWRAWAPGGYMAAGLFLSAVAVLAGARKVPTHSGGGA